MAKDIITVLRNYHQVLIGSLVSEKVKDFPVVETKTTIEEIFRILTTKKHVWVVESKKTMRIHGLITEKDMLDIISPKELPYYSIGAIDHQSLLFGMITTAKDVAKRNLITIDPYETVGATLLKMKHHNLRRLPVVKNGLLISEISIQILMQEFMKILDWHRWPPPRKER